MSIEDIDKRIKGASEIRFSVYILEKKYALKHDNSSYI